MNDYQVTLADILTKNKLFLSHPGEVQLTEDLYAGVSNSKINVAKRRRFTGKIKASSNNLSIGGQAVFTLDPGVIYGNMYIIGKLTFPLNTWARAQPGWGYRLIKNLMFTCSGSASIASVRVTGESLMDMVMLTCNSQDKRQELLQLGGEDFYTGGVATTKYFAIPLYMFFTGSDQQSVFPFDAATIRSQISFSIEWNNINSVISNTFDAGVPNAPKGSYVLPTDFDQLYLRVHSSVELDSQYVANTMAANPYLAMNIPVLHYQSFQTTVNATTIADEMNVSLSTLPIGMLQGIVFSARPRAWLPGAAAVTAGKLEYNGLPVPFEYVKVLYNGQVIYETNNSVEERLVQTLCDDNSSASITSRFFPSVNLGVGSGYEVFSGFTIIPFCNEISNVLRDRHHEFTPSYGGSTLQVIFQLSQSGLEIEDLDSAAITYQALPTGLYDLNFSYIVNGLIEVNQGTMTLQLE